MKEALKMALEALEMFCEHGAILRPIETRDAIKEALAQPEQEPVAMLERDPSIGRLRVTYEDAVTELDEGVYPLYTTPPQRTWVGLANHDWNSTPYSTEFRAGAEWAEAKLKEKNT